ncbi:LOW QUALITY PROTEIN: hypothetical protein YC2023_098539 [Brassica napus]
MKINIEKAIQQYFPANTTIIRLISSILSPFTNWFHPCIAQSAITIRFLRFLVYNSRQQRSRRSNESIRNQLDRTSGFKGRSGIDCGLLFLADGLNPWRWTTNRRVYFGTKAPTENTKRLKEMRDGNDGETKNNERDEIVDFEKKSASIVEISALKNGLNEGRVESYSSTTASSHLSHYSHISPSPAQKLVTPATSIPPLKLTRTTTFYDIVTILASDPSHSLPLQYGKEIHI